MTKILKFTLLVTLIFGIFVFLSSKFILRSFKEPNDMYSNDFDITEDYIGERIEGDVPFSLGQCAVLTETKTRKGFKTKTETYYYIIPVNGSDPEYYHYICISTNKNNLTAFDALTTHFYLETYGSHKIEGTLAKLDDETYEYMLDYVRDMYPSITEEELKEYFLPICFEQENYKNAKIALAIDIVLFIITIGFWFAYIATIRKNSKKVAPATSSNVTYVAPVDRLPRHVPIQNTNFDPFDINGDIPYEVNGDVSSKPHKGISSNIVPVESVNTANITTANVNNDISQKIISDDPRSSYNESPIPESSTN